MLAAGIAQSIWGGRGLLAVAAVSGLADVDALTLSVANMPSVTAMGVAAVLVCVGVNSIAKCVYAWVEGGARLGLLLLGFNAAAMAVAVAAWSLVPAVRL